MIKEVTNIVSSKVLTLAIRIRTLNRASLIDGFQIRGDVRLKGLISAVDSRAVFENNALVTKAKEALQILTFLGCSCIIWKCTLLVLNRQPRLLFVVFVGFFFDL